MKGWGGVLNQTAYVHGIWTRAQSATHITYLELLGVVKSVSALLPRLARRRVLLFVDNQAVVYIIRNFTSRAPLLMAELRNLVAICESNDTILQCQWVPTDRNLADEPSRRKASDHWRLDPRVFYAMCQRYKLVPTVDRFATAGTTLLPRWNSPCPEPGAEAVDGLSTAWTTECNWVHPPPDLLPQVASKLERTPALAVVVAPFWPAEDWFRSLRGQASAVTVVPHARRLVCQHTLSVYGIDAQGDWPLVFFLLDPGRAITPNKPLCTATWASAADLLSGRSP
jgi:hypothetical protein